MSIWLLIGIAILVLVTLISVLKLQPFISFLVVSLGLGDCSRFTDCNRLIYSFGHHHSWLDFAFISLLGNESYPFGAKYRRGIHGFIACE